MHTWSLHPVYQVTGDCISGHKITGQINETSRRDTNDERSYDIFRLC